jgi:uncharacterized membrane protein
MAAPEAATPRRLDSIDLLRGAVMILMALDHSRDFFAWPKPDATDLASTTPVLFATRWVTHFCAPVFCFLAGTAAFLSAARGKPKPALAWFLITRGVWLILLDVTLVRFGFFGFAGGGFGLATLWALGCGMIVLAALLFLPTWAIGAFAVVIVGGHDITDGFQAGPIWNALHSGGFLFNFLGMPVFAFYPVLPWIAVMAGGYAFGEVMLLPAERRRRVLWGLGAGMIVGFLLLRGSNLYGDPRPWSEQPRGTLFTALSFLNCEKYPPSLSYLLMTMGPSLLLLGFLDGIQVSARHPLIVFGRVPMFYYLTHLFVLHIPAWLYFSRRYGASVMSIAFYNAPPDYGTSLWVAYLAWGLGVAALYPVCRWYATLKEGSRNPWLSYL